MDIKPYRHEAKYYETDQMGIIHHSNYIRWMEEARIDFLSQIGISYKHMEEIGLICPILEANCKYKRMVKFGDVVAISVKIEKYTGVKFVLSYEMINEADREICTLGQTVNCFLNKDNKLISLKKDFPELHKIICQYL